MCELLIIHLFVLYLFFTANRSPVLASMLTALWMTLASLLLSAVMH